jgi:outer membrane protein TolC
MHLTKSASLLLVTLLSLPLYLSAQDKSILSEDRLNLFDYNKKQNEENSNKLKKDWINPLNLTISKNYGEVYDTTKSMININQPIFKSGGIYKAIKYANASYLYNNLGIDIQKKNLIKDVTTMLFNLHIVDLSLQKNKFLLKNADIDIIRKKEQVLNGFLDTSYLDKAILDANKIKNTLVELQYQKESLNNTFSNLASGDYGTFSLPKLELTDKKTFLQDNITLRQTKADIAQKDYLKDMTVSQYLPTLNAKFDFTKYHDIDSNSPYADSNVTNYGLALTMPLDVRTFNNIEVQKINYLKAKLDLKTKTLEEENFYKTKISKIKMLDAKKQIAKDDFELYNSLLVIIIEEKNAELKTQSDVDTLLNSQKIKSIDLKIYELEEQIELLDLYAKIS